MIQAYPPGTSKSVIINGSGTVNYYCSIHPWMKGTITVVKSLNDKVPANPIQLQSKKHQKELPLQQPLDKLLSENQPIVTYFKPKNVTPNSNTGPSALISPKSMSNLTNISTPTGTEPQNKNNWITASHDIFGTRSSNQTTIDKNNVNKLQIKWILNTQNIIEDSPIIVGDKGFAQDNDGNIFAFNANTESLWKVATGNGGLMHGLTFDHGAVYAGSGKNATVVALNSTTGEKIWESQILGPNQIGYSVGSPPMIWKNYVVVGSAGGDYPPYPGIVQGNITALNKTSGDIIWNLRTTTGEWVTSKHVPPNGGGTTWSGGAFDPKTGLLYVPIANPTPDFNPSTRQNFT